MGEMYVSAAPTANGIGGGKRGIGSWTLFCPGTDQCAFELVRAFSARPPRVEEGSHFTRELDWWEFVDQKINGCGDASVASFFIV